MKLLKKYQAEFEHLNNKALAPILQNIDVFDIETDDLSTVAPQRTIFTGNNISPEKSLDFMSKYNVEHFVQTDKSDFIYDLFAASIMLQKPLAFIKNPLPFFINNFKTNDGEQNVRSMTMDFSSSREKPTLLHNIRSMIEENPKTANFMESVHLIADELIMNSLYNAPINKDGAPIFMNFDRSKSIELPENKKSKIFITHDQRRLLIGCEDPYGSVNSFKLLKRLNNIYKEGLSTSSVSTGGAGLGCKMMIDNSCGFYMIVQKNKSTLVCCSLPLGVSYTKAERMSKNLHMVFF